MHYHSLLSGPVTIDSRMNINRNHRHLEFMAAALLLVTFFAYFAVRIWDIDFWWHIAAGREIVAAGAIPSRDPFGVYDAANNWGQTVLKSQWLGQVLLFWIYRFLGLDGIIYFRAALLTACLGIVYWRCRIANAGLMPTMLILALAGIVISTHTGERPQLFSFAYLSLTFLLIDLHLQTTRDWPLYLLPPLFLVWANSHGGVVYGEAMLVLFGGSRLLERMIGDGTRTLVPDKKILFVIGLCIAALLIAPNGLTTLKYIAFPENQLIRDRMSEYMSPWSLWPETIYYWIFFGICIISLPGFFNRAYFKQGILVVSAALISLTAYRYIPLFILLAAPYIASSIGRIFRRIQVPQTAVSMIVIAASLLFLVYGFKQNRVFQHGIMESKFPVAETALIKANHLTGRMFNTMNWGGYLTWNLSPAVTVFLDGRVLDPNRIEAYSNILWLTPEGRQFLEQESFDLVLIPPGNSFTGERYPLVDYLLNSPDWKIVYQSSSGYLFARAHAS